MSEFFLVLAGEQNEIDTLEEAHRVCADLAAHVPDKTFKVYRCKRWMQPAKHFPKLHALLREIVRDGLTPALRDRADILLQTIRVRNDPATPHMTRRRVPEFEPRRPT